MWVAADGLIYQQFADNVKQYLVDPKWLEENEIIYATIGVDFGGTKSAHSFTLTGFTRGYKQVVVLDEYYCKKRINPKQLQDDFIDFVRRVKANIKYTKLTVIALSRHLLPDWKWRVYRHVSVLRLRTQSRVLSMTESHFTTA